MNKSIKIFMLLAIIGVTIFLFGCNNSKKESSGSLEDKAETYSDKTNPIVTINMEDGGIIKIELYPKAAPNTVNNFISLVNKDFYNGLTFHRIEPGFVIQGGDPKGNGTGGPDYKIKGEFKKNGFDNNLKHTKGVISMARSKEKDSAGSQFFIMLGESSHLDGDYAAFGKVVEGIDVVDNIAKSGKGAKSKSTTMKKVTVDLKGKSYKEPEKK